MKFQDQPLQVAMRLKEEARTKKMARVDANGWSFVYSTPEFLKAAGGQSYGFSAMLQPECRSSTVEDWQYLGAVMGAIGMPSPEDPTLFRLYTDVATADPNSALKWFWDEPEKNP